MVRWCDPDEARASFFGNEVIIETDGPICRIALIDGDIISDGETLPRVGELIFREHFETAPDIVFCSETLSRAEVEMPLPRISVVIQDVPHASRPHPLESRMPEVVLDNRQSDFCQMPVGSPHGVFKFAFVIVGYLRIHFLDFEVHDEAVSVNPRVKPTVESALIVDAFFGVIAAAIRKKILLLSIRFEQAILESNQACFTCFFEKGMNTRMADDKRRVPQPSCVDFGFDSCQIADRQ